jgi:hypothetical protein
MQKTSGMKILAFLAAPPEFDFGQFDNPLLYRL